MFLRKTKSCDLGKPSEGIRKLKLLTKEMDFAEISTSFGKTVEVDMEKGISYMVGLMKESTIAVARHYASAESVFPKHQHAEWELLLVYKGVMNLYIEGKERTKRTLYEKDFYYILPHTVHYAEFPEECRFLAITIPGADAWPDGD